MNLIKTRSRLGAQHTTGLVAFPPGNCSWCLQCRLGYMFDITSKQRSGDVGRLRYLISHYIQLPSFCALIGLMDYSKAAANLSRILLVPRLRQGKSREIVAQSVELHQSKTGDKAH